jgi:hypothetical protein
MRLDELQREPVGEFVRYSTPLPDESGAVSHELIILGPETRVRESFAETDFDVTVRPGERRSVEDLQRETPPQRLPKAAQYIPSSEVLRSAFDDPRFLLKESPPDPTADDSVFVTVLSTRIGGTYYNMSGFPVSTGPNATHFWGFSGLMAGVHYTRGATIPLPNDQGQFVNVDLYLGENGASGNFPVSSTLPGAWPDFVEYATFPGRTFTPIFKVPSPDTNGTYLFQAEAWNLFLP